MSDRKKSRRARGTGTIFRKGAGWVGRKPVGRHPNGTTQYVERTGRTQAEVIRKLAEAAGPNENATVREWSEHWQKTLTVRASTRYGIGNSLDKYILPAIGTYPLARVNTAHIEMLIADLLGKLGRGTTRLVVSHCQSMFGAAVRAGLIPTNPVALSRKPHHHPAPIEVYTPDQLRQVIAVASSGRFVAGAVVATLAATGMRIGEALALDIADWDGAELNIRRTYTHRYGLGPTKSRHSERRIGAPAVLVPILEAAIAGRKSGPIFVTSGNQRRSDTSVFECFRSIQRQTGLPQLKVHGMRHSVATALVASGVPLPDVAKYLGDTVATVAKTYLHPSGANPAAVLDKLYGGDKVVENSETAPKASKGKAK